MRLWPYSRVLHDMVHKSNNGGPFCSCVLVHQPARAVFRHDELWMRRDHPVSPQPLEGGSLTQLTHS